MYNSIKFFNLAEESFLLMKKTTKQMWILGVIISILSGGLIISDTSLSDVNLSLGDASDVDFNTLGVGVLIIFLIVFLIIIFATVMIIGSISGSVSYYLYRCIYEIINNKKTDRAPLGLVVKVNSIVLLKGILGLILFIVPGIIVFMKYAPVNYILCKYPELSSKEILRKSKDLTEGIRWKLFMYSFSLLIIESVVVALISPNTYIPGLTWIDIITTILNFVVSTSMLVFSSLLWMNLYMRVDNIKSIDN